MTTVLLAVLLVVLLIAYLVDRHFGGRIVVTTTRGESLRGTQRFSLSRVVLTEAESLSQDTATPVKGRVEIRRRSVALIQRLPAEPRQVPAKAKAEGPVSLTPPAGRAGRTR